jgi:hypothetical protein
MTIRVKHGNSYIQCDVSEADCKKYECLSPHKYTHYVGSVHGNSIDTDKYYSCSHRNYHGCPVSPKFKITDVRK